MAKVILLQKKAQNRYNIQALFKYSRTYAIGLLKLGSHLFQFHIRTYFVLKVLERNVLLAMAQGEQLQKNSIPRTIVVALRRKEMVKIQDDMLAFKVDLFKQWINKYQVI